MAITSTMMPTTYVKIRRESRLVHPRPACLLLAVVHVHVLMMDEEELMSSEETVEIDAAIGPIDRYAGASHGKGAHDRRWDDVVYRTAILIERAGKHTLGKHTPSGDADHHQADDDRTDDHSS